jgi:pyruvate,water dikinase
MERPIAWFEDLTQNDAGIAGGEGANLGELVHAGLPVPPGFVVTAQAYLAAMERAGVRRTLVERAARIAVDSPPDLLRGARELRGLVGEAGVPDELRREILAAYHRLGDNVAVAVRSSATSEDAAGASFAGMNESFTNLNGDAALVEHIVRCWASIWGERVIAYRKGQRIEEEPAIAVVVQRMVDAEAAGVLFTVDPAGGDDCHMVIEAAFGLGEVVVAAPPRARRPHHHRPRGRPGGDPARRAAARTARHRLLRLPALPGGAARSHRRRDPRGRLPAPRHAR